MKVNGVASLCTGALTDVKLEARLGVRTVDGVWVARFSTEEVVGPKFAVPATGGVYTA